jgi:lysozyme
MKASDACISLIQNFEGCRLTAYRDLRGILTIGFGDTHDVSEGQTITREDAEARLKAHLDQIAVEIGTLVTVPLEQCQLDALASFCYNCGTAAFARSKLLKFLNAGDTQAAADAFLSWDMAAGRQVPGLLRRREAERELFLRSQS